MGFFDRVRFGEVAKAVRQSNSALYLSAVDNDSIEVLSESEFNTTENLLHLSLKKLIAISNESSSKLEEAQNLIFFVTSLIGRLLTEDENQLSKLLLQVDLDGYLPMHLAAHLKNPHLLMILLKHMTDKDIAGQVIQTHGFYDAGNNLAGFSILHIALRDSKTLLRLISYLCMKRPAAFVRLCASRISDPIDKNLLLQTPLSVACSALSSKNEAVRKAMRAAAKKIVEELHVASAKNYDVDVAINSRDAKGYTALYYVVKAAKKYPDKDSLVNLAEKIMQLSGKENIWSILFDKRPGSEDMFEARNILQYINDSQNPALIAVAEPYQPASGETYSFKSDDPKEEFFTL